MLLDLNDKVAMISEVRTRTPSTVFLAFPLLISLSPSLPLSLSQDPSAVVSEIKRLLRARRPSLVNWAGWGATCMR
jgi:hypothetical protein